MANKAPPVTPSSSKTSYTNEVESHTVIPDSPTGDEELGNMSSEKSKEHLSVEELQAPNGLQGINYYIVMSGLMLSIFLVSFDKVVIATALPVMASKFSALDQAPWIATAFLVTQAGFLLAFGQLFTVAPQKAVYLVILGIFEAGNLLCAVAWNFPTLVAGRAIAGVGGGGIYVAVIILASSLTRLDQRPIVFAFFGIIIALANITGPLVGGAFTEKVSWRWCFYVNLPFGAVNASVMAFCLKDPKSSVEPRSSFWRPLMHLDWVGNALCLAAMFALLYPLQDGGVTMPWSDKRVIISFCMFGLLTILFILWENHQGAIKAVLPLIMFTRRTLIAIAIEGFLILALGSIGHFFLPLYYQVARDRDAIEAGIDILPYLVGTVAGTMASGIVVKRTHKPWPFLLASPLVTALISGFIFWVMGAPPKALRAVMAILQIIYGWSVGAVTQQTMIYAQAEYRDEPSMVPQVSAMINFFQTLGSVVGVATSGAVLNHQLRHTLQRYAPGLPQENFKAVLQSISAVKGLDAIWKEPVKKAYADALSYVFLVCVPAGVIASTAALLMTRRALA